MTFLLAPTLPFASVLVPLLLAPSLPQERAAAAATVRPADPRPGAPGCGDPYYPGLGNGGYDVLHYDLVLDVEVASGWLTGQASLRARALADLSSFNLDLHALDVDEVEVNGAFADFEQEGRELVVVPEAFLPAGQEFEVVVRYGGVPELVPEPAMAVMPGVGWIRGESGIYVLSECVGAASWFPCNDHPSDKATFDFRVTVEEPYVVAANGVRGAVHGADGRRTFEFRCAQPMATYLATVNIAEFAVSQLEGPDGLPMPLYHPKDATPAELQAFERQGEIVAFFEGLFGDYPFDSLGAVLSYERLPGALETQTLPVYGRGMTEPVVAHEVAHQWFGDHVTPARWQDMWLNEAFASYAEWLWLERNEGAEALEQRARSTYRRVRRGKVGPTADPGVAALFGANVYVRGPLVLHVLRGRMGDEAFFELLRRWCEAFGGANATTEDFLALLDRTAPEPLSGFLRPWLSDPIVPRVEAWEGQDE